MLLDFFIFWLQYCAIMALTLGALWVVIVVCDWVEDVIRKFLDNLTKPRKKLGKY